MTKYNEKIENEVNSEDEEFENDIVELNVSGSTSSFAVKLDLLRSVKDSILEQMFKKEVIHKLPKLENKIFIDRDPETFRMVLIYLRNGQKLPFIRD